MATPTIPFEFHPAAEERATHLSIVSRGADEIVSWGPAGVTFTSPIKKDEHFPEFEYSPNRDRIEKANSGLVTFHGDRGYSIGSYHEFLVSGEASLRIGFQMGRIEVTFGGATPLMAYLFDAIWEWKYYGGWNQINTARIVGASDYDEAELAFTNAAIRYHAKFNILPTLWDMNIDDYLEVEDFDENAKAEPMVLTESPAVKDIEPLRFYYRGLTQWDNVPACLYYYRVLEYYSFLTYRKELSQARHNSSVSDDEFIRRCFDLLSRDDKSPMLRLINLIADDAFLNNAATIELVKNPSAELFGQNLYAFRNSIVHGKDNSGYVLHSPSIFKDEENLVAWRIALRTLAKIAIDRFGRKLL